MLLFPVLYGYSQSNIESKHEIYASYGFAPTGHTTKPEIGLPDGDLGGNTSYSLTNQRKGGTINIGYLFHATSHLSLGLSYSYNTVKDEVHQGSSITLANTEIKNHIILINAKYTWLNLSKFSFYSRGGIGVKFSSKAKFTDITYFNPPEQENQKRLAWQISALGVEWKFLSNLAIFAEGGAGIQGCAIVGAKVFF